MAKIQLPPDIKDKLIANMKEHMNVPAFLGDLLDEIALPMIQAYVDATKTPFDNLAFNFVKDQAMAEVKAQIAEIWEQV